MNEAFQRHAAAFSVGLGSLLSGRLYNATSQCEMGAGASTGPDGRDPNRVVVPTVEGAVSGKEKTSEDIASGDLRDVNFMYAHLSHQQLFTVCKACAAPMSMIVKLDLCGNNIDNRAIIVIARLISRTPLLEKLDLSDNHVTSVGVIVLGKAARTAKRLERLILSDNKIGDSGMRMFCRFLTPYYDIRRGKKRCARLNELHLNGNPISLRGWTTIAGMIKTNPVTIVSV